jgi:hypothetical protein
VWLAVAGGGSGEKMSEIGAVLSEIDIILGFRVAVWQCGSVAVWQLQFVVAVAVAVCSGSGSVAVCSGSGHVAVRFKPGE